MHWEARWLIQPASCWQSPRDLDEIRIHDQLILCNQRQIHQFCGSNERAIGEGGIKDPNDPG